MITKEGLISRFEEAGYVLRALPDKERGFLRAGSRGSWPTVIVSFFEAYGMHAPRIKLPPPAPAAIDRLYEVFEWVGFMGQIEQRGMLIVWLSYAGRENATEIGRKMGLHRQTVRGKRNEMMAALLAHVNGTKKAA